MKKRPYIVFAIIGVLVIIIAFLLKPDTMTQDEFVYGVLLNIGFVILTIVIVNFLWFLLGGDPTEKMIEKSVSTLTLASDGFDSGLYRAFSSSSEFATASQWVSLLKDTKEHVDMMGYSLHILTRTTELQNKLINLANCNVQIRILIMDENNEHFSAGLNIEGISSMTLESMKEEVRSCRQCIDYIMSNVKENKRKNINFKTISKGLTECQIIRTDDKIFITPYLYSKHTSDSPLFIARKQNGGYYDKYVEEFEMLWNLNI